MRKILILWAIGLGILGSLRASPLNPEDYSAQILKLAGEGRYLDVIHLSRARIAQDPHDCRAYKDLAQAVVNMQDRSNSISFLEQLQRENPGNPCADYAWGLYFKSQKQYERALDYFQAAVRGKPKSCGPYLESGFLYHGAREYVNALKSYEDALDVAKQLNDRDGEVEVKRRLAVLYLHCGRPDTALRYLNEALALSRMIRRKDYEAQVLVRMAETFRDLGELSEAKQKGTEALAVHAALGDAQVWFDYVILGDVSLALGDRAGDLDRAQREYQNALGYFNEALRVAPKPEYKQTLLISLGDTYLKAGDPETARQYYQTFLREVPAENPVLKESRSSALGRIGEIYLSRHAYDEALTYLHKAVHLAQEDKNKRLEMAWVKAIGDVYARKEEYDNARKSYDRVLQETKDGFFQLGSSTREEGYVFFEETSSVYEATVDLLLKMDKQDPEKGYACEAFDYVERARSQSMLQVLFQSRIVEKLLPVTAKGPLDAFRRELAALHDEVQHKHKAKLKLVLEKSRALADALLENKVRALELEIDGLYKQMAKLIKQKIRDYDHPTALVDKLQQKGVLGDHETLIEYTVSDEKTFVFVVTRGAFHYEVLPVGRKGGVKRLHQQIAQVSRLFSLDRDDGAARPRMDDLWANIQLPGLKELYEAVFQPIEKHLRPGSPLIIVPDDALYYLPFEMLVTGLDRHQTPQYLLSRYPIAYSYSAGFLLNMLQVPDPPRASLLMANPDFGQAVGLQAAMEGFASSRGRLSPLPYAEEEVYRSRKFLNRPMTRVGAQATEAAFKRDSAGTFMIHVATHSFFDSHNYLDSKIVFALDPRIDQQGEDGVLYLHEIMSLRLKALLVVLTGCETGVGRLRRGGGLEGLSRAFLSAGVPSVMGTLWPVLDSQAMPNLMGDFYKYLAQGLDKREALQKAKLDLIAQGSYTDPFYWAPLVLVGDTRGILQVREPMGISSWFLLPLTGLLALIYFVRRNIRARGRMG